MSRIAIILTLLCMVPGCSKQEESKRTENNDIEVVANVGQALPTIRSQLVDTDDYDQKDDLADKPAKQKKTSAAPKKNIPTTSSMEKLDFDVENDTGKTVYLTCFSYIKKRPLGYWRWDKSRVYEVKSGESATIDIDVIPDEQDRMSVYGYLGVFGTKKEADQATFELMDDRNKLDLDLLVNLKGKKVTLDVKHYGFLGEFFDFDFVKKNDESTTNEAPEVDFMVENNTGKTILITCFVYQKKAKGTWFAAVDEKDDMEVWRFDKTEVLTLAPGQSKIVDVDTITEKRDRDYVRGYLAVYDEHEAQKARDAIFELLPSRRKLYLGTLSLLKKKKIVIEVEEYGIAEDFIDFVMKPVQRIDFSKVAP